MAEIPKSPVKIKEFINFSVDLLLKPVSEFALCLYIYFSFF